MVVPFGVRLKRIFERIKTKQEDWAKVQVQLELKHNHALHKCKSCQRQFLSWATKGTTSTADWQFCQTVEFINSVDKNLWAMGPENFATKGLKGLFEVKTQEGFDLDLDIDSAVIDLRDGNEIDFAAHREDPSDDGWFDDEDSDEDSDEDPWFSSKDSDSDSDSDNDTDSKVNPDSDGNDEEEEESSDETIWTNN